MAAGADSGSSGRARTSVWLEGRPAPKRRGERPTGLDRLDRDRIVAATVRLLDSEGLARFSMRRLAAELGVTAMSVYWYVDTKDDLLELALDAVTGEVELEEDPGADWRDQLRELAVSYRGLLVVHPWVSPLMGEYLNVGPHALAVTGVAQRVLRRSGLAPEQLPGALALIYQFTYGFATIEGRFARRCADAGISQDDFYRQVIGTIEDRPEFDETRDIRESRTGATVEELRTCDFAFALDCVIAGIESLRAPSRRV
ncbi:TetR/AcrR family transcriptional regulator [Streptomyces pathocidini]|uniref:TetR/AcrR family transcriptional regulator n=1 Tax=Streptomyces pathocidini TaxID=1650571 RepID=A0ABW7USQ8_9ACTN|nr:TetR/AcrR family transcriptional regulator C-terminal domain-containing protein [Streptomyces pathocidini]